MITRCYRHQNPDLFGHPLVYLDNAYVPGGTDGMQSETGPNLPLEPMGNGCALPDESVP